MWVLIFALYNPAAWQGNFGQASSQEFTTKEHCLEAKATFEKTFGTNSALKADAICVEK